MAATRRFWLFLVPLAGIFQHTTRTAAGNPAKKASSPPLVGQLSSKSGLGS